MMPTGRLTVTVKDEVGQTWSKSMIILPGDKWNDDSLGKAASEVAYQVYRDISRRSGDKLREQDEIKHAKNERG